MTKPAGAEPIRPGAFVTLSVDGLDVHGDGVSRTEDGLVVFVEGALPGDRVRAVVTQRLSSHARARVVDVERPSGSRVEPPCPVAGECGGCPLMSLAYPAQLEQKRRLVEEALERIGGLRGGVVEVRPTLGMESPWRYRNKAQYPVASGLDGFAVVGFYRRGTHAVIPIDECAVQHPTNVRLAMAARRALGELGMTPYDEKRHAGLVRHLVCRVSHASGEALLVVVTREAEAEGLDELARRVRREVPELVGVLQNVNPARTNVILGPTTRTVWGRPWIEERVGHLKLRLSATAFFQVNTLQAVRLYDLVRAALQAGSARGAGRTPSPGRLIDLYCGVGGIGLYCANEVGEVVGVERDPRAVEDARQNARLNGITNARFIAATAEEGLARIGRESGPGPGGGTAIVVDPPRRGLEAAVLRAIVRMQPDVFVYVSCNPSTLARDIGQFIRWSKGEGLRYELGPVQPVDMFPHTAHVEAVAFLTKVA